LARHCAACSGPDNCEYIGFADGLLDRGFDKRLFCEPFPDLRPNTHALISFFSGYSNQRLKFRIEQERQIQPLASWQRSHGILDSFRLVLPASRYYDDS
jgi:hypothetical protein